MRPCLIWFLLFALGLPLVSCGALPAGEDAPSALAENASRQNSGSAQEALITVTDLSGAEYSFDAPLERVVVQWSCAGGPFLTMSALLGEDIADYLAGIDDSPKLNRADMWAQFIAGVPELAEVPVIGSVDREFNLEAVLASDAQAAILPLELKSAAAEVIQPRLERAGIPVLYIDYHGQSMENHVKSTELLGRLFGREERARELIAFYQSHRGAVTQRVEALLAEKTRPSLYIEVGIGGPKEQGNSYNNSYMWGAIAYAAGGYSIGEGVIPSAAQLDPEYLLAANPDKIVFTGSYWPATPDSIRLGFEAEEEQTGKLIQGYLNRPGWQELAAVQKGEIYAVHHSLGREIYDCAAYEFFAKVCFPEEFADLDPEATLREYYQRFLPYEYSGLWFWEY